MMATLGTEQMFYMYSLGCPSDKFDRYSAFPSGHIHKPMIFPYSTSDKFRNLFFLFALQGPYTNNMNCRMFVKTEPAGHKALLNWPWIRGPDFAK